MQPREMSQSFFPQPQQNHARQSATDISFLSQDLLEHVLTFLAPADMLKASHVSRHWRAASLKPIQTYCVNTGLELPLSGTKNWWALQAHAQRIAKRWKDPFMDKVATFQHSPALDDRTPYCFKSGSIQVTELGVYIDGKQRVAIDLPRIGSDRAIAFTSLPTFTQDPWHQLGCVALTDSTGFVLYSETIRLFQNRDATAPSATTNPPTWATSATTATNILATGHRDGVRLWKLPTLDAIAYLPIAAGVDSIGISVDGAHLVANTFLGTDGTFVYDTSTLKCIQQTNCNEFFFDNCRSHILFHETRVDDFCQAAIMRYHATGIRTIDLAVPLGLKIAYNDAQNTYIFADAYGWIYFFSPCLHKMTWVTRLDSSFGDYSVGDMAVSRDSRWLIFLLQEGDILLWDLSTRPTRQADK